MWWDTVVDSLVWHDSYAYGFLPILEPPFKFRTSEVKILRFNKSSLRPISVTYATESKVKYGCAAIETLKYVIVHVKQSK